MRLKRALAAIAIGAMAMVLTPGATTTDVAAPAAPAADTAAHPPAPPGVLRIAARRAPTYYYASAHSQYVDRARGAKARFTVHRPRQVTRAGDHSLAEIAIRGPRTDDIIEAGWRTDASGRTRLFVYWWKGGRPQCYNGCGFVERGHGIKPGSRLKPGIAVTLKWVFKHRKWQLRVNGKLSGYYPKSLWHGRFRRPRVVQVFGEVVASTSRPCIDMGSGRPVSRRGAAKISRVKFVRGPEMRLRKGNVADAAGYSLRVVNNHKLKYGGRGRC